MQLTSAPRQGFLRCSSSNSHINHIRMFNAELQTLHPCAPAVFCRNSLYFHIWVCLMCVIITAKTGYFSEIGCAERKIVYHYFFLIVCLPWKAPKAPVEGGNREGNCFSSYCVMTRQGMGGGKNPPQQSGSESRVSGAFCYKSDLDVLNGIRRDSCKCPSSSPVGLQCHIPPLSTSINSSMSSPSCSVTKQWFKTPALKSYCVISPWMRTFMNTHPSPYPTGRILGLFQASSSSWPLSGFWDPAGFQKVGSGM